MKKQSRNLHVLKQFFNIRIWCDYDRIRSFLHYLSNGISKLLRLEPKKVSQSFETVQKTLKLSDDDLLSKQRALFRLCIFMMSLAMTVFGYAVYLVITGAYRAAFISIAVVLIALVLSFRYHFWYFQIMQRKLGCTIREWFEIGLLRKKS